MASIEIGYNCRIAYYQIESEVDRVELFRLTLRFFDDVIYFFSIPTLNFSTTRRNFQSLLYMLFFLSSKFMSFFYSSQVYTETKLYKNIEI